MDVVKAEIELIYLKCRSKIIVVIVFLNYIDTTESHIVISQQNNFNGVKVVKSDTCLCKPKKKFSGFNGIHFKDCLIYHL